MKITKVYSREILDSRGFPTVACTIELENGRSVCASVPAGASVGTHEAYELRDNDPKRFFGRGVLQAVHNLETKIAPVLIGQKPDVIALDKIMIELDGTENKSKLGANAILAASIAITRAQALVNNLEVFQLLQKLAVCPDGGPKVRVEGDDGGQIPNCMFNIINGGMHADSGLIFQEFMVMPKKCHPELVSGSKPHNKQSMFDTVHMSVTIYNNLKKLLHKNGYATGIGDEGGFAPQFELGHQSREKTALDFLVQAIEQSGYSRDDVGICLDIAASSFYDTNNGLYLMGDLFVTSEQLVDIYCDLVKYYPIISIEDGMSEDDWRGWELLTKKLGDKVQLVGDDLFVTNSNRIKMGIEKKSANAVLIKPNQIGTVSETVQTIQFCKQAGYKTVVSHRSGETNDSFIADLVVGTGAGQFKAGACARGERVAKYNRLLEIEEFLIK